MRWRDEGQDEEHITEIFTNDAHRMQVPANLIEGMREYVLRGRPMGHFLTAVFSGDLFEAYSRADLESRNHLYYIVSFIYNETPAGCFRSPEKVESWQKRGGYYGLLEEARREQQMNVKG